MDVRLLDNINVDGWLLNRWSVPAILDRVGSLLVGGTLYVVSVADRTIYQGKDRPNNCWLLVKIGVLFKLAAFHLSDQIQAKYSLSVRLMQFYRLKSGLGIA